MERGEEARREWPNVAADAGIIATTDSVPESEKDVCSSRKDKHCKLLNFNNYFVASSSQRHISDRTDGHAISCGGVSVSDPGCGVVVSRHTNMEVSGGESVVITECGDRGSNNSAMDAASAAKKRRKQSKPVRCWATPGEEPQQSARLSTTGSESRDDEDDGSEQRSPSSDSRLSESAMQPLLDLQNRKRSRQDFSDGKWSCPHCDDSFENEEHLRIHIELEHVQKLLEKQLQQHTNFFQQHQRNLQSKDHSSKPSTPLQAGKRNESPLDFAKNFPFPGMQPLIPISQAGPDGKLSMLPLNMFQSPMAQFLFPGFPSSSPTSNGSNHGSAGGIPTSMAGGGPAANGVPTSTSGNSSNGSGPPTTPGGSLRIFNPEAFCELCNKEFCNKYFLKTHKANKHGIYSVESLVSSPYASSFFPPGMQQMLVEQQQQLLQVAALSRGQNSGAASHQQQQQSAGAINMESFCEICQKEFCNKYFLKKHKQKIHGIIPVENSPSSSNSAASTGSVTPSSTAPSITAVPTSTVVSIANELSQSGTILSSVLPNDLSQKILAMSSEELRSKIQAASECSDSKYNPPPSVTPPTSVSPAVTSSSERKPSPTTFHHRAPSPIDSSICSALTVFTPEKLREMGVINAEAFCEICCKEFCNKYFLRTHKQNKHGIMDPTLGKLGQSPQFSPQQNPENLSRNNQPDNSMEDGLVRTGADFDLSSSGGELSCEVCNRPFSSQYLLKMHKFYNHNIPYVKEEDERSSKASSPRDSKLPPKDTVCKEEETATNQASLDGSRTASPEDAASQDLQKLQSMIRDLTASITSENRVSCHMCRTEFENKYFLRAHMMNEHGMLLGDDGELAQNPFAGLVLGNSPAFDSEAYCEICQKEFCSKYFLRTHKQNIHGINIDLPPGSYPQQPLSDVPQQHQEQLHQQLIQQQQQQQRKSSEHQAKSPALNKNLLSQSPLSVPLPLMPPPPNSDKTPRSYVTGRNYCNICNKELCNKYFMKTHMLKMHGINLDEQPADAARNSTIGGVTCEICQKELCSKYFLKVHKQNTHGIYEDPPPGKENSTDKSESYPGSGLLPGEIDSSKSLTQYSEICPLCERRFKSIKWLKTHMMNDHNDMLKENFHRIDSPASALLALMPPPKLCIICGQGFPDKVSLQIHLIKEHRTSNEELGLMNLTVQSQSNQQNLESLQSHRDLKAFRPPSAPAATLAPVPNPTDLLAFYQRELNAASPQQFPLKLTNGNGSPVSEPSPRQPTPESPTSSSENPEPFKRPDSESSSTRVYHCSYCVYSTRWLSNLYAHEKRHTGVAMEGDKKFICRICHRAYRYNHSLQRHMLNHRPGSLGGRFYRSPFSRIFKPSQEDQPEDLSAKDSEGLPRSGKNRRFRCSRCDKKYPSRELCLSHIFAEHGIKVHRPLQSRLARPFKCRLCAFAARTWNVLKIHIIKQHQQPVEQIVSKPDLPGILEATQAASGADNNNGQLPMTYVIPQSPPTPFILQPFLLAEPESGDEAQRLSVADSAEASSENKLQQTVFNSKSEPGESRRPRTKFVPSLVYLPVCQKVLQPMTVAFTLTPA